jgi:mannose-6-phosphate isomerase class I
VSAPWENSPQGGEVRALANHPCFHVEARRVPQGGRVAHSLRRCAIVGLAQGALEIRGQDGALALKPGDFCLLPAVMEKCEIEAASASEWIVAEPGGNREPTES